MRYTIAVALLLASQALAQGRADAMFRRFPFDQWRTEGNVTQFKWQYRTPGAVLSPHQRLVQRFEGFIEAAEIQKRRTHGQLVLLLEIEDSTGHKWRTRDFVDLSQIPADLKAKEVTWVQDVYILPGTYKFALAIVDAKTREHNFVTRDLKVNALRSDPLPQAFSGHPAVEFARLYGQPDAWFQPRMTAPVSLQVPSRRPIHIDIVMNMTLSDRAQGSLRAFRRNMSLLIPCLRVLSGMKLDQGALDITVLDLAKKKKWEQLGARGLNWDKMREAFASNNPGIIDIQSLAGKAAMQQFFWDSVLDRIRPEARQGDEPLRVVIVLSSPVFLERQYKVEPATFPKDPDRRVYYLQYRPLPPRPVMVRPDEGAMPPARALPSDDLEHTLKLLDARVFPIISPEQFRKALATILADIAKL